MPSGEPSVSSCCPGDQAAQVSVASSHYLAEKGGGFPLCLCNVFLEVEGCGLLINSTASLPSPLTSDLAHQSDLKGRRGAFCYTLHLPLNF